MTIILLLLAGLGIGAVSGVLGIGGGVLLVPILMWCFQYEQPKAQGITLAVLAVPVVLPAVWQYYVKGVIKLDDVATAACIAAGFGIGGFVGASFVHDMPLSTLRLLF